MNTHALLMGGNRDIEKIVIERFEVPQGAENAYRLQLCVLPLRIHARRQLTRPRNSKKSLLCDPR